MSDDPYLVPFTDVLRNKLDILDSEKLEVAERLLVTQRAAEGVPQGQFDLPHLCAIHRHLFQDVYDWAGEIRTVDLAKQGAGFQPAAYIGRGMDDVYWRLVDGDFLRGRDRAAFSDQAAIIMGDVNHVHPFREGNGRTQLFYFEQLAAQAGHPVLIDRIDQDSWMRASAAANKGDYSLMASEIGRIADDSKPPAERTPDRGIDL